MAAELYFEDFEPGREFDLGEWPVTEEAIIAFGHAFDPLPFHVDPEAAAGSPFGGLIASGRHSCVIWMRLYVDAVLSRAAGLGSPGMEELRWHTPVRPGDVLRGSIRVLEATPSSHRPDRGTVRFEGELHNQAGELATSLRGLNYFARRAA